MNAPLANKIDLTFLHLDIDRNGLIERQDMLGLGSRLLLKFSEPTSTAKGQALLEAFDRFWDALAEHCDTDRDHQITPDEYRAGMIAAFVDGGKFDDIFRPAARALAIVADTDGDGRIDQAEFQAMEAVLGISAEDSRMAFDKLDTDSDGALSVQEYLDAVRDYYTNPDPEAPGNWLYGPAFQTPLSRAGL
ncbi:EF-hand domain-containing protein [Nocardia iowensis]|uniref:EF-hand domain-containing protein n=2 Tax=Nocardia iowensis TaxID=204891 RepID=A0ABX8RW19_NOCIO|nr:EF-hand domain-containing protein [Nocardia iowensis]QXN93461.1 EF-hand domain-containing protein [Nocardia iowensis]